MTSPLFQILNTELTQHAIVFARLVGFFAFAPIFGEKRVSVRIRVLFTLMVTLVVTPTVARFLPSGPVTSNLLLLMAILDFILGAYAALIAQILLSTLDIAGAIAAYQIGFANALAASPASQQQTSLPGLLFSMITIVVLLALDYHHVFIMMMVESFQLFPPINFGNTAQLIGDQGAMLLRMTQAAFTLALQIAAPTIIIGLLMFFIAGIVNRLIPGIQVFFILQPLQIFVGLFILFLGFVPILGHFIEHFGDKFQAVWNTR